MDSERRTAALAGVARDLRWYLNAQPWTLTLSAVLVLVYLFQLVLVVQTGTQTILYWFTASVTPSPGWLISILSHSSVNHLLTNLLAILIFGSLVEERLSARHYLLLFTGAGWIGTIGQVLVYRLTSETGPAVGASAGALAFTAYYLGVTITELREFEIETRNLLTLSGLVIIPLQLASDFGVIQLGAGNTALTAHLLGILVGLCAALLSTAQLR